MIFWGNVYRSALISRNLPCLEQFLIVHLHIYDTSNLIFVHWNCIDSIYRNHGGLVVWYLKRWPGFDSQPRSILSTYSKLSPVNDLFLKILKHIYLPYIFLQNIRSEHFFSYAASENIVHQNKFFNFSPNFLHFSCWFGYSSNNSILGYIYLQSWKLVIVNLQIKISPIMLSRQLNFGVLLAWQLFYVYYKGKNSTFFFYFCLVKGLEPTPYQFSS